jgi:hypothetical protein
MRIAQLDHTTGRLLSGAYLQDPFSGERFQHVRENLSRRFKTICCDLSIKEFDLLIEKMARQQIRGELRPPI